MPWVWKRPRVPKVSAPVIPEGDGAKLLTPIAISFGDHSVALTVRDRAFEAARILWPVISSHPTRPSTPTSLKDKE